MAEVKESTLKICIISEDATVPKRATDGSAGYDLYASEDRLIYSNSANKPSKIKIGISVSIPRGTCGKICPRSGFTVRTGVLVVNGTVDSDYRGELSVMMINYDKEPFAITKGMRIAQLVIVKISTPEVEIIDKLEETSRKGGFGSTGMY